ncbi:endonuclease domain-containing protein [Kitasatospora sp. NPDC087315]|uniref:endonuclease domain-containing protein n=1 Tax=Kitasatospora sp. NPDC087315 TaxID=3364069 RepID=UPI00382928B3
MSAGLERLIPAASFLEEAFLRWVLTPAAGRGIVARVHSQYPVTVEERTYRLDYLIAGDVLRVAVELDGFAFHSDRGAFTYDRMRQNDLAATGLTVLRFSYDAVRTDTARCVAQLQAMLRQGPALAPLLTASPHVEVPDMVGDPMRAADPPRRASVFGAGGGSYFDDVRARVDRGPLRACQDEALAALANYYACGGRHAAAGMAVGAGKTALGVAGRVVVRQAARIGGDAGLGHPRRVRQGPRPRCAGQCPVRAGGWADTARCAPADNPRPGRGGRSDQPGQPRAAAGRRHPGHQLPFPEHR